MRLHRFYIQNENFETLKPGDSFICAHPETVKQVGLVLRAQIGDRVRFFNETGEWEFEIMSVSKKELLCVAKELVARLLQKKRVILIQSLIKKDKFEWVAQKVTELGVTDIIPIVSERSEKRGLDEKRLQKIIVEATEQSGWGRVVTLHPISTLEETLIELTEQNVPLYTLNMGGTSRLGAEEKSIALCVGPEGGWGEHDQDLFKKNSVKIISLGASVLRAETAAIVGIYEFLRSH
ncbi:MAG: RsmE family RNA methyltransferase [Minisyncoccia bacterium]